MNLKAIYLTTLARCAPETLVQKYVTPDMPRNVVAIGKCAGALLDGVVHVHDVESAFVAVPEGYRLPQRVRHCHPERVRHCHPERSEGSSSGPGGRSFAVFAAQDDRGEGAAQDDRSEGAAQDERSGGAAQDDRGGGAAQHDRTGRVDIHLGGHPHMTAASFAAGRALLGYLAAHDDILFLVSGGGSACVEVPAEPHSEDEVARVNAALIASGKPIGEINAERRKYSAIKGGKLRERVRGRAVTLVYSDVSTGALADVAAGPTISRADEGILVADNLTLVRTAAQIIGDNAVVLDEQLEGDVLESAALLASRAGALRPGEILVAGGEPTVRVRGAGRGGRCSELAVRFAAASGLEALFGSSDGVDGNSGVAGWYLPPRDGVEMPAGWEIALADSDSGRIAAQVGEPITIAPTGNNLRDLFLIARR